MSDLLAFLNAAKQAQKAQQMTHRPFALPAPVQALSDYMQRVKSGQVAQDGLQKYATMLAPQSYESIKRDGMKTPAVTNETIGELMPGGGLLGTIGGKTAKTADMALLAKAGEMKAAGAKADDIYAQTKWWLDHPDGKPRFEIDDSGAELLDKGLMDFNAGTGLVRHARMMSHPELRRAYRDTDYISYRKQNSPGASYEEGSDTIRLPQDAGHPGMFPAMREEAVKSPALHELQHAVQGREGFARGGSPGDFSQVPMDTRYSYLNDVDLKLNNGIGELVEQADGVKGLLAISRKYPDAYAEYSDALHALGTTNLQQARANISKAFDEADKLSPYEQYRALAGETEARLVQKRMNMTMQERLNSPFYKNYDVPLDQQIVRGDTGISQSVAPKGLLGDTGAMSPKTGQKFEFDYLHNTEKTPYMGEAFGQHVEPVGQYVIQDVVKDGRHSDIWKSGKKTFSNPLVLDWGKGGYKDPDNWKNVLSKKYGGKTGKALTSAVRKDGYDGIVTIKDGETSEIIDILSGKQSK